MEKIGLLNKLGIGKYLKKVKEYVDVNIQYIETTYDNLVSLRNNSQLIPGQQYRIIDYVTTTTQENTQSAGHQFDVIVTADNENTLNEVARTCLHDGDTYFADSDLNAWQIWYCIDNDINRFEWADNSVKSTIYIPVSESMRESIRGYIPESTPIPDTLICTEIYASNDGIDYYKIDNLTAYADDTLSIVYPAGTTPQNGVAFPETLTTSSGDTIEGNMIYLNFRPSGFVIDTVPTVIHSDSGKGVIYRMIDEFNNDCPYDFKNIQFKHPKDSTTYPDYYYTFSTVIDSVVTDHSLLQGYCYNNIMKEYINSNKQKLNNNVFLNTSKTILCYSNFFEYHCASNSFGNGCALNSFGNGCALNSFGNSCGLNSFGNGCNNNSFGNSCGFNSFGTNCNNNSFGNGCNNNSFGNSCGFNSFGTNCNNNSFGNGCYNNSFGNSCGLNSFRNGCSNNSFGTNCYNNSFGDSCIYNSFRVNADKTSVLKDYICYNHFDDGCSYNVIWNSDTTSSSVQLKNINVNRGVLGTSSSYNMINIDVLNSEQEININQIDKTVSVGDILNVKYQTLKSLRDNHQLIAGQQYRIIDYVTTTNQLNTLSAGHQFDIIVTADNENTLNEKARAIQHKGDTYFANSNLAAWQIWYKLDNDDNYSWVGEKDIVEYSTEEKFIYQKYLENCPIVNFPIIDSEQNTKTNPYYSLDSDFNQESINVDGYFDSFAIEIKNGGINEELKYILYEFYEEGNILDVGTDEYGNYFVSDKKHHVNDSWVVDIFGKKYYYANDASLIVPIDYKIGDTVYYYSFIINPHDGTAKIIKANEQKGIIYRMIDEYDNECPYDFKNILYLESEDFDEYLPGYYYTFSKYNKDENIITDKTTNDNWYSRCNIIKKYKQSKIYLNNIKLISNGTDYNAYNEFDYDCHNIYILSNSNGNKFIGSNWKINVANECFNNIFYSSQRIYFDGSECAGNIFKQNCDYINLHGICCNNIFKQNCSNISITESNDNTFEQYCEYIEIDGDKNKFFENCHNISFARGIDYSIFEQDVSHIKSTKPLSYLYVDSSVNFDSYQTLPTISNYPSNTRIRITKGFDNNIRVYTDEDLILSSIPFKLNDTIPDGENITLDELSEIGLTKYVIESIMQGKITKIFNNYNWLYIVTYANTEEFSLMHIHYYTDNSFSYQQYKFEKIDENTFNITYSEL